MKKTIKTFALLFYAALFIFQANSQALKKGYVISGVISGADTGKIYLSRTLNGVNVVDSTKLKNGKFSFKGSMPNALFCILRIDKVRSSLAFFAENSVITITAKKDSLYKATITGSGSQKQYEEWSVVWNDVHNRAGDVYKLLATGKKDSTGNVTMATDPAVKTAVDKGFAGLNILIDSGVNNLVTKYPSSAVGSFVIIDRYINYPDPERVKKFYNKLDANGKATTYGKDIAAYMEITAKTAIGAMPNFAITDTSGKVMKLSSLKGKYVLVDFWASWCVPCRKENPNVVKAYQKFHDKGFEIVGVSLDTKKEAWMKAIYMDGLAWNHVSDLKGWESGVVKDFGIKVVPTSFLLDKNGKIIANNLRGELLEEKLAGLMN